MASPNFQSINPEINEHIKAYFASQRRHEGRSMKAYSVKREALALSLKATGQAQPASILWFNPVAGRLDGGIPHKLRSINDPYIPEEDLLTFKYQNREYRAVYLKIKEPLIFSVIEDVKVEGDREYGVYVPKACKQIEVAYHFLLAYTSGTPNSSSMGGILAFEGDRSRLERGQKKLTLNVPHKIPLPDGWSEYTTKPKDFDEALAETLDLQRQYSNLITQQAQSSWDQEDQRGNITPIHRTWHQHELDMGWRQTAAPWVTMQNEPTELCAGCGTPKKRVDAFFCEKCQRVYSPFDAYMAKEIPITHFAMERIKDEDWPKVRKEEERRKALRAGI